MHEEILPSIDYETSARRVAELLQEGRKENKTQVVSDRVQTVPQNDEDGLGR